jgi:hypothetical protein
VSDPIQELGMIWRVIHYHTGMVACDTADAARAKDYFSGARAINPHSVALAMLVGFKSRSSTS